MFLRRRFRELGVDIGLLRQHGRGLRVMIGRRFFRPLQLVAGGGKFDRREFLGARLLGMLHRGCGDRDLLVWNRAGWRMPRSSITAAQAAAPWAAPPIDLADSFIFALLDSKQCTASVLSAADAAGRRPTSGVGIQPDLRAFRPTGPEHAWRANSVLGDVRFADLVQHFGKAAVIARLVQEMRGTEGDGRVLVLGAGRSS